MFDVLAKILVFACRVIIIAQTTVLETRALACDKLTNGHDEVVVLCRLFANTPVITGFAMSVPMAGTDVALLGLNSLID